MKFQFLEVSTLGSWDYKIIIKVVQKGSKSVKDRTGRAVFFFSPVNFEKVPVNNFA